VRTSEQTTEIAPALVKAQAAMKNATLNKVNPHFKSKFADLAEVRNTVTPTLAANDIAVVQALDVVDGQHVVLTRLLHKSGQWVESLCPIPAVPADMQKMGSAITYARRYSLSAICGIAADEDDDANAAVEPSAKAAPKDYAAWVKTLDTYAATHTDAELITEIAESGSEEQKAYLRGDAKTLTALRTKAAKNQKAKAA
jgi:hypothetical protein